MNQKKPRHTVITTIHQPASEVWALFDQLLLLSKGRICYFGPSNLAIDYFASLGYVCPANFNPADFLIDLLSSDFDVDMDLFAKPSSTSELADAFASLCVLIDDEVKKDCDLRRANEDEHMRRHSSSFEAFITLIYRNWINILRNPAVLGIRLVLYLMCAFMWGLVYRGIGNGRNQAAVQGQLSILFAGQAFFTLMTVAVLPYLVEER